MISVMSPAYPVDLKAVPSDAVRQLFYLIRKEKIRSKKAPFLAPVFMISYKVICVI